MTKRERDIQRINLVGGTIIFLLLALIIYFVFTCNSNKTELSTILVPPLKPDTTNKTDTNKNAKADVGENTIVTEGDSSYIFMHENFVGKPSKTEIEPLMEAVMQRHGLNVNKENLLKFAKVLIALRERSIKGITEMEILQHMHKHGEATTPWREQAAFSKSALERAK